MQKNIVHDTFKEVTSMILGHQTKNKVSFHTASILKYEGMCMDMHLISTYPHAYSQSLML